MGGLYLYFNQIISTKNSGCFGIRNNLQQIPIEWNLYPMWSYCMIRCCILNGNRVIYIYIYMILYLICLLKTIPYFPCLLIPFICNFSWAPYSLHSNSFFDLYNTMRALCKLLCLLGFRDLFIEHICLQPIFDVH